MNGRLILADVNVWLATIVEAHPHHGAAREWWIREVLSADDKVAFCRITQLGLLRLLTNEAVMGKSKRSVEEAYADYIELIRQDPITYLEEPEGIEGYLRRNCSFGGASRNFWTDSYLAAFAAAGAMVLTTFDRGFQRFGDLKLRLL